VRIDVKIKKSPQAFDALWEKFADIDIDASTIYNIIFDNYVA